MSGYRLTQLDIRHVMASVCVGGNVSATMVKSEEHIDLAYRQSGLDAGASAVVQTVSIRALTLDPRYHLLEDLYFDAAMPPIA